MFVLSLVVLCPHPGSHIFEGRRKAEEGEEKGGKGRALNICMDVQEPRNCRIRRTFVCIPTEGRGKEKLSFLFNRI